MAYIATDRDGKFLLSASYGGNKVSVTRSGRTASCKQRSRSSRRSRTRIAFLTDPTNRYVLHTSLGGDLVYQEKFDAKTGRLTPNDPPSVSIKTKAGARHLVFSPNGKFAIWSMTRRLDLRVPMGRQDRHPEEGSAGHDLAAEGLRGQTMGGRTFT